jgi:predicted transporter
MSPLFIIFAPFVRLVGHSLASSVGFSAIALVTVLPVESVRKVEAFATLTRNHVQLLEYAETVILVLDITLLIVMVLVSSGLFLYEEWKAIRALIAQRSP